MSEELLQTIPQKIGKYTYYRLGATTLDQLKTSGIIPAKDYASLKRKKPDGLAIHHDHVVAVVEYKTPAELKTDKLVEKAIGQEVKVAKALCKILIVTDTTKSFWINALNGERIKDGQGNEIRTVFHPFVVKHTWDIEHLLDEIQASITSSSSVIRSPKLIDPSPLASRLWQTIWVATGKSSIKCLYNVVELFIFKFLSDLKVLDEDIAFAHVYEKAKANPEDALDYYAKNSRTRIYKLFPEGADKTTIINGTIFVAEDGEANLSQSILFKRCLEHLQEYSEQFGSLTKIDKQFKTKLYESFLKEEVEALGQYLTPRRVVQSMVRLAGIDEPTFQFRDKRFLDPFCGVGGFPLEMLNMNEAMRECYRPDENKEIHLPFVVQGFDKGFERDDERTIILAKANMLIYLAELLFANPDCTAQFAEVFNETFTLIRNNLGTFGQIVKEEKERYDYILSNPPYVTSGSGIIKEEIRKTPRTQNEYPINGIGLESLSVEWVIKSLKRGGGKAFLIIPDGILGRTMGKKLRNHILSECYLDAIISLPRKTFFPNDEHTYILAITKKNSPLDVQETPVLTYLVSNFGERLTSVKREEIDDDDFPEMEASFKMFMGARAGSKALLEQSLRCKIQDISKFRGKHWVINRWWTKEELVKLGMEESLTAASASEVAKTLDSFTATLQDFDKFRSQLKATKGRFKQVTLGDKKLFNIFIGERVLKKDIDKSLQEGVPVYSANVFKPFGLLKTSNIADFDHPSVLWGIDGNFDMRHVLPEEEFATTDHCGTIQILDESIMPEYLVYALTLRKEEESFDRSFRASLANMKDFKVGIPIRDDGSFDVEAQREIAAKYMEIVRRKEDIEKVKSQVDALVGNYLKAAPRITGS